MPGWLQTPSPPPLGAPQQKHQSALQAAPLFPHARMFTDFFTVLTIPDVAPGNPSAVYYLVTASTPLAYPPLPSTTVLALDPVSDPEVDLLDSPSPPPWTAGWLKSPQLLLGRRWPMTGSARPALNALSRGVRGWQDLCRGCGTGR